MTMLPVSVQICVICARRSWLPGVRRCGDAACQRHHARAGDGLISMFAKCLSPAAGRGNTGLWALPLTGGPRWYVGAGGTLEDAEMWASSPHTAQSGSARSRMGSHLRLSIKRAPAARPAVAPSAGCAFPRAAVRVRRRQAARVPTHPST
jgi:hypothetical protein